MPVYIGKSGDLVGCYRCLTHSQTENSATQLVSSIKHKLSHAIRAQTIYTPLSGEATTYSTNENPSTDKLNTFDNQLFFYQDKAGMTTPKSSLWFLVGAL